MNETIDSVLKYWFGTEQDAISINQDKKALWWSKNEQIDAEIENRFKPLVYAVSEGKLDHWRESAKGLLASIICTDQFPRNIFRGNSKSFGFDEVALSLAQQMVGTGADAELAPIQRVFAYLPFEHSEDLAMQDKAVQLFTQLREIAVSDDSEEVQSMFAGFLDYAQRHFDVIEEFGRFPHRNTILGRESTAKEIVFLQQPGSSF